jgi:hypothetical protein
MEGLVSAALPSLMVIDNDLNPGALDKSLYRMA